MPRANGPRTKFENSAPILKVADMAVSLRYYVDVLGFKNADWGTDDFTSVNRDRAGIYLCRGGQGQAGTWVWIGVQDVEALCEEYKASGAKIRHAPLNFPWAYEMKVEDPDGHVLRFGSEPKEDRPFDLDGYNGETVDELIALEGKYRIDSLVLAFEQALLQKAMRVGDEKLTDEERIFLAIKALECEVYNGGYGQFWVNCSREDEPKYVPIIVDALRRIGCPKTAEITQKAMKIVEKIPMTDDEIENGTWEENEEREGALRECDDLYYQRAENIEGRLFAFIKANRAKIKL